MNAIATQIDNLLLQHESLWRPTPFAQQAEPAWQHSNPALARYLLSLSDRDVQRLQGDDTALLTALSAYFSDAEHIRQLISTPQAIATGPEDSEPPAGIPGRKWQQITAFLNAIGPISADQISADAMPTDPVPTDPVSDHYIEWCAGKAYLGESLCVRGAKNVLSLEIQTELVDAGNARSQKLQFPRHTQQCDVLKDSLAPYLKADQHLLALHACGGLHQRLLTAATEFGCRRLHLSPCCYHRYCDEYQPLSTFYRHAQLKLDRAALRLAVRQTATARAGETTARRTLQAWQLSLRALLAREGIAAPAHFPTLPMSWAQLGFTAYSSEILRLKALPAFELVFAEELINEGWQQLQRIERLELLTMCFRRLLELRCVTDSQLYLQENGYRASIHTFCAPSLTPRNFVLAAELIR